ncbi:MAG: hypothetical protein ACREQJ_09505, partial [Candidatus Binatia bacterium]
MTQIVGLDAGDVTIREAQHVEDATATMEPDRTDRVRGHHGFRRQQLAEAHADEPHPGRHNVRHADRFDRDNAGSDEVRQRERCQEGDAVARMQTALRQRLSDVHEALADQHIK